MAPPPCFIFVYIIPLTGIKICPPGVCKQNPASPSFALSLTVADIHFRIQVPYKAWLRLLQQRYAAFMDSEPPDWEISVTHAPDLRDTDTLWATHDEEQTRFRIAAYAGGIDLRHRQAEIATPSPRRLFSALERTLVFILIQALPRRGDSLLLHACGVVIQGKGYLFCGPSGAGKSTIALLAQGDGQVLGDENIVIRMAADGIEMLSTPFWGLSTSAALIQRFPQRRPLHALFLLHQAPIFALTPLRPAAAAWALLATEKVAVERPSSAAFWLQTLARLIVVLPVYRLSFRPTPELWAFLQANT